MAKHKNNVLRIPTKSYRKANVDEVIDVGFFISRDFSPISWLIRQITKKPFSEIHFKFRDKKLKERKVFFTDGVNIKYSSEKIFNNNNKIISETSIQINTALCEEFLNECHKNTGIKHNILRQIFKPKDRFKPEEWLFYLIADKTPNWTNSDPQSLKDIDIFNYLSNKDK